MILASVSAPQNQYYVDEGANPYAHGSWKCDKTSNNINVAFTLLGILLILFSVWMIITGLISTNYMFIIVGVGSVIVSAILLIIGVFMVVTISGDVCYN